MTKIMAAYECHHQVALTPKIVLTPEFAHNLIFLKPSDSYQHGCYPYTSDCQHPGGRRLFGGIPDQRQAGAV
jgi:hypothetical protein